MAFTIAIDAEMRFPASSQFPSDDKHIKRKLIITRFCARVEYLTIAFVSPDIHSLPLNITPEAVIAGELIAVDNTCKETFVLTQKSPSGLLLATSFQSAMGQVRLSGDPDKARISGKIHLPKEAQLAGFPASKHTFHLSGKYWPWEGELFEDAVRI